MGLPSGSFSLGLTRFRASVFYGLRVTLKLKENYFVLFGLKFRVEELHECIGGFGAVVRYPAVPSRIVRTRNPCSAL